MSTGLSAHPRMPHKHGGVDDESDSQEGRVVWMMGLGDERKRGGRDESSRTTIGVQAHFGHHGDLGKQQPAVQPRLKRSAF